MNVPDRLVPGKPRLISLFIVTFAEASGMITADHPEQAQGRDKEQRYKLGGRNILRTRNSLAAEERRRHSKRVNF